MGVELLRVKAQPLPNHRLEQLWDNHIALRLLDDGLVERVEGEHAEMMGDHEVNFGLLAKGHGLLQGEIAWDARG